ncbi:inner membrane complex protein, putative [Plasmodium vinckei brucechwatti]|uniref:Inner membrane complex protein, putative n=1 Tax=Plasmodium vinckei brucechwatti TaxID=119398 RepID=A0A6V7SVB0_PLAVN|nr:inner membrane complex protein, putative [Plasmodium vinckei brucechwatti]
MASETEKNTEKVCDVNNSFDETNDTLPDNKKEQHNISSHSNANIETPQPQNNEYSSYANAVINQLQNNFPFNFSCTGNTFSCKPQNTKVFTRRVDTKKKFINNKSNSLSSSFSQNFNPYNVYPNHSFIGNNAENYDYGITMNHNSFDQLNSKYMYDQPSKLTYGYFPDSINYSINGQCLNPNNGYMNIPLCSTDYMYNNDACNFINGFYPLNQNGFTANYAITESVDVNCEKIMKDILKCFHNIIRYIFKTLKLSFAKINKDLNIKDMYLSPSMPSVHEMDMDCDICRSKYGHMLLNSQNNDYLKFFEGENGPHNLFTRILEIINNWLDAKDYNDVDLFKEKKAEEIIKAYSKEFEQNYYEVNNFPTTDDGKIELPHFNNYGRTSAMFI